jgi:hypothetical protein
MLSDLLNIYFIIFLKNRKIIQIYNLKDWNKACKTQTKTLEILSNFWQKFTVIIET